MYVTNGLYAFNKTNRQLKRYTQAEGLANNVVCGLCEDANGNIWASTFGGLSKINPHNGSIINFYSGDGIQGNEFTRGAAFKAASSEMFFGGTYGITYFYGDKITFNEHKPQIFVTNFQIAGNSVNQATLSGGKPVLNTELYAAKEFRLNYKENSFSIAFSTFQFENSRQTYYRYRIKQLDHDWRTTPIGGYYIAYNNLQPGKYTLQEAETKHQHQPHSRDSVDCEGTDGRPSRGT